MLSAALHLVGLNVRLPHVTFGWPWQSVTAGTTTDVSVGPWVLQKIEGISRPALGTENFNFTFTHKVSKNIGIWPCWYSSTFATTGHASATVDLNPGPALVGPAHRPLPAAGPVPAGHRGPGPGQRGHRPAAAPAAAVGPRRHRGRHDVAPDRRPAQLDLSGARLRRADTAAVLRVGALRPGAEPGVRRRPERPEDHRAADQGGRDAGRADHQEQLRPADRERARLYAWPASPCNWSAAS